MKNKLDKNKTVIITVSGGVAEIFHNPEDINVIIVDYDNLNDDDCTCPNCWSDEDAILENGICNYCGFDTNNLKNNLE